MLRAESSEDVTTTVTTLLYPSGACAGGAGEKLIEVVADVTLTSWVVVEASNPVEGT